MHLFVLTMFAVAMASATLTSTLYSKSAANPTSAPYRDELAQALRTVAEFNAASASFARTNPGQIPATEAALFTTHGFTPRAVADGRSALVAGHVCYEPVRHTPAALAAAIGGVVGTEPACVLGRTEGKGTVLVPLHAATEVVAAPAAGPGASGSTGTGAPPVAPCHARPDRSLTDCGPAGRGQP